MFHSLRIAIYILRYRKNPFKILLAYFLLRTGLNKRVSFRMNGYRLNLSGSALAIVLFANRNDRKEDEDFLTKVLKPGDTYIDVGANIGTLVLTASKLVSNTGKVVGIEAHPVTFRNLQANVSLNKFTNIRLIQSAVGDKKGSLFFSSIKSDDQNKVLSDGEGAIEVPVNTLDELIKENENIALLKIDVEGYEKFVLQGALATMKKTRIIYIESWEKHFENFGYNTGDIISNLNKEGFDLFRVVNSNLISVNKDYRSEKCEDLVALRDVETFANSYNFEVE